MQTIHTTERTETINQNKVYAVLHNGTTQIADTLDRQKADKYARELFNNVKTGKAELKHWNGDTGIDTLLEKNY